MSLSVGRRHLLVRERRRATGNDHDVDNYIFDRRSYYHTRYEKHFDASLLLSAVASATTLPMASPYKNRPLWMITAADNGKKDEKKQGQPKQGKTVVVVIIRLVVYDIISELGTCGGHVLIRRYHSAHHHSDPALYQEEGDDRRPHLPLKYISRRRKTI